MERVLELLKEQGTAPRELVPDAYAVVQDVDSMPAAMAALQQLRTLGVRVQMQPSAAEGMASLKSQFKKADASGSPYACFAGDELARGAVLVKSLRDGSGAQVERPLSTWPNGPAPYNRSAEHTTSWQTISTSKNKSS